ncbi:glycoside hydrolase family 16 protein [Serpula lacrymans var. lacrymans S7.3]|uniref:Glycoside hydrolase family 16 protein n=2 Tax=Serpula lacrymans var. lacrymans TaxID=341189 RepID=F8QIQ6_SERL3|nr:glycoside hydrolase family 16 protein [Serpula lacrymans var. lacrymans S7.9]EGN91804.1 glycoside hydrolase family 16 protein [Serpula lacrymans var. lacrymans S7.3]EGO26060.1 glycoside hydrolase family 16 protein [Serpula lacrymans var. lacrymans S7.9]
MRTTGYAALLCWFISSAVSLYTKKGSFIGSDFLTAFEWDTFDDPTHGRVNYVDQQTALSKNLTIASEGKFIMRADYTDIVISGSRGRDSIRIHSKNAYDDAIFILDLSHMPEGCATWPAFWTLSQLGPWPNGGEIDIIEGVNLQNHNLASMHTTPNCTMSNPSTMQSTDCNAAVNNNQGCGVSFSDSYALGTDSSYGSGFNLLGGGWYAMQKDPEAGINVWFWPRNDISVPVDVRDSTVPFVGPTTWGSPQARFQTGQYCDYETHFDAHEIVFDLTFCGDWAGSVFPSSGCSPMSCADFVDQNPSAFTNAYWEINSLIIYTKDTSS